MIDFSSINEFKNNLCTFEEASIDENPPKKYVTHSQLMCINYDKGVTRNYYSALSKRLDFPNKLGRSTREKDCPKAVDSLYITDDGEVYFIEFKINKKNTKPHEIRQKALESLLSFMEITSLKRSEVRKFATLIVAYGNADEPNKYDESSKDKLYKHYTNQKAKTPLISSNLERYKGIYFKDIITFRNHEFDSYIQEKGWTSMKPKES